MPSKIGINSSAIIPEIHNDGPNGIFEVLSSLFLIFLNIAMQSAKPSITSIDVVQINKILFSSNPVLFV